MASQDVIELNSSDDEPEPAPKKIRTRPRPNTMVQIHERNINNLHQVKKTNTVTVGKNVYPVLQNRKKITTSSSRAVKSGHFIPQTYCPTVKVSTVPLKITPSTLGKVIINPINVMNENPIRVKKMSTKFTPVRTVNPFAKQVPKLNSQFLSNVSHNLKTNSQKCLNKLPPSITVTKTTVNDKKRIGPVLPGGVIVKKRRIEKSIPKASEVLTVDLDDDDEEVLEPRPHPVWCLKPEQSEIQQANNEKEMENNKEPELCTVEITIEDSPVKLIQKKFDGNEIGRVLEITIDDSPVKPLHSKKSDSHSESGTDDNTNKKERTPHSKKKLQYPIEVEDKSTEKSTEQEVKATETDMSVKEGNVSEFRQELESTDIANTEKVSDCEEKSENSKDAIKKQSDKPVIIEIIDSPAKLPALSNPKNHIHEKKIEEVKCTLNNVAKEEGTSSQDKKKIQEVKCTLNNVAKEEGTSSQDKKKIQEVKCTLNNVAKEEGTSSQEGEYHPQYQKFIDLCFKMENTEDMKKIVEKKIKGYYKKVPKSYTESEEFIEIVSSKIVAIEADPERLYLYIKDIVDELNMQRKMAKSKETKEIVIQEDDEIEIIEIEDSKRQRQIRKLEKALKKVHRAVQKLEEEEVDFDDEADSVYLLTESEEGNSSKDSEITPETDKSTLLQRYKERGVRIHAELCRLNNTRMPSEPRVHIEARPGKPKGPAQRLEKWVNRKVPIGTPLPFPDFHDVVRCVRDSNEADRLGWSEIEIMEEARDLFMRCGKKLQRRRQENEWRLAASRLPPELDPAEEDIELKKKLDDNKKLARTKESDIIDKYVDRQNKLNLEPQEIGDKEAEHSPVESEDENVEEIENTSNRDTLKEDRLLSPKKMDNTVNETKVKTPTKVPESNIDNKNITDNHELNNHQIKTESQINNIEKILGKTDKNYNNKKNSNDMDAIVIDEKDSEDKDIIEIDKVVLKNKEEIDLHKDHLKDSLNMQSTENNNKNVDIQDSVQLLSDDDSCKENSIEQEDSLLIVRSTAETSSNFYSSDTDAPIAISDTVGTTSTLEPSENCNNSSDVVSVEQSSNSDSDRTVIENKLIEINKDKTKQDPLVCPLDIPSVNRVTSNELLVPANNQTEGTLFQKKTARRSNDEYTVAIEEILLASDDESIGDEKFENDLVLTLDSEENDYVNLKDDLLTIEENTIENSNVSSKSTKEENADENVLLVNTESDSGSPVAVSIEETLDTDDVKVSKNKETDVKKKKENKANEILNLFSVESMSSEEIHTSDLRTDMEADKKTDEFNHSSISVHKTFSEVPEEKNDLVKACMSKNEEIVKNSSIDNVINNVTKSVSISDDVEQELEIISNSDSQSSDGANSKLKNTT